MLDYIEQNVEDVSGAVLMGSWLGALGDYPLPVMHVSGDLDGVTTVTAVEPVFR